MWPEAFRLAAYGTVLVAAVMVAAWAVHLSNNNAGIVDVAWSANLAFLAILYAARARQAIRRPPESLLEYP